MPVQLDWKDDARTCLIYTFENRWTWDDFFEVWARAHELVESSPHPVNIIADFTRSNVLPDNVLSVARSVDKKLSSSSGRIVVVGTSAFLSVMIDLMRKTGVRAASQIYSVRTMAEAEALLADQQV